MSESLLLGFLVGVGLVLAIFPARTRAPMGWLLLLVGVAVFAIRLQHDPFAWPRRGNLLAGVLCLALGLGLVLPWLRAGPAVRLVRGVLAAGPVVLFFGLYSTLAELEEVVILRAPREGGDVADLRLWIVEHEGAPWVTMPRAKADAHGLDEARVELVRDGTARCVVAHRVEDHDQVDTIHRLRHDKYAIQRLATALGIFTRAPSQDTVALRLEPCPG